MNKYSVILAIIFQSLIIYMLSFYYLNTDDFTFLCELKSKGVWENLIYKYNNWDGRHLSIAGLFQMVWFKNFTSIQSVYFIYIISFLNVILLMNLINVKNNIYNFLLFFTLYLIGILPFFKEIIFWQTGGIYQLFFLQSLSTILIFNRFVNTVLKLKAILIFFMTLILSLNTQNFNLIVIVIIFTNLLERRIFNTYNFTVYLLPIILGTLIIQFSPGNNLRLEVHHGQGIQFKDALYLIFVRGSYHLFLTFLSGFLVGNLLNISSQIKNYKYIVLIFVSIIPFLIFYETVSIRILYGTSIISFLFGINCSKYYRFLIIKPIIIGYLSISILFIFFQIYLLNDYGENLLHQRLLLLDQSSESMDVTINKLKKPSLLKIIREPYYFTNDDMALNCFYSKNITFK